jgi:hypothetical protein
MLVFTPTIIISSTTNQAIFSTVRHLLPSSLDWSPCFAGAGIAAALISSPFDASKRRAAKAATEQVGIKNVDVWIFMNEGRERRGVD